MEEDEEVDIVGGLDNFMSKNEREISSISSGQILSCEYTVHPRWLSDNNDGTELWSENLPKQSSQDEMELVEDEVVIEEPAPIDFDWVEETEEVSNCDDIILEQDIPASLEEVVTNSGTEADDDNSDAQTPPNYPLNYQRDQVSEKHQDVYQLPTSKSLLKVNYVDKDKHIYAGRPLTKFKQTLLVNRNLLKLNQYKFNTNQLAGTSLLKPIFQIQNKSPTIEKKSKVVPPAKFKQSVTILSKNLPQPKTIRSMLKKRKEKSYERQSSKSSSSESSSGKHSKKKFVDLHGENITINHDVESTSVKTEPDPDPLPIPQNVVKIKDDSESDIEIDIESDVPIDLSHQSLVEVKAEVKISPPTIPEKKTLKVSPKAIKTVERPKSEFLTEEVSKQLEDLNEPTKEFKFSVHEISDLEKYFHQEFFEGRPTKTPERYKKIRDFILNTWYDHRPSYVSKTTVRNGLKHCGDVNCISRIHTFLEQIGAINFGQAGVQFEYIRPLSQLREHFAQAMRKQASAGGSSAFDANAGSFVLGRRQRIKSFTMRNEKDVDANYTVSHSNGIPTLIFPSVTTREKENYNQRRERNVKLEFELIECLRFNKDKIAPFKVSITLSTLLCLHLHALSSKLEVMGFLGGYCTKSVGRDKLSLTRYKPCKTAQQSGTTCEMCPVSQVEQSSNLKNEGYDLLGWFHSHPTFEPNPSRTDVNTQADMQQQFSMEEHRPFIGFILGCIDMSYNCMYILPEDMHSISVDTIPYSFEVDVIKDSSTLRNEIRDVFNVIDKNNDQFDEIIQKFIRTANNVFEQYGHNADILDYIKSYL